MGGGAESEYGIYGTWGRVGFVAFEKKHLKVTLEVSYACAEPSVLFRTALVVAISL